MTDFTSITHLHRSKPDKFSRIRIVDHSEEELISETSASDEPFCTSCRVDEPRLNDGGFTRGNYMTYLCTISLLNGTEHSVRKRYSECLDLKNRLTAEKPGTYVPRLPPKSFTKTSGESFVESRRAGIELFLRSVVLNPDLGDRSSIKEWLGVTKIIGMPTILVDDQDHESRNASYNASTTNSNSDTTLKPL